MAPPEYHVHLLIPGYVTPVGAGRSHASCSITLVKGPRNIVVDTGIPGQREAIIAALQRHGLALGDIHYVILTHGHSDHVGNNNLFPQATFLLDGDVSQGDEYWVHDFRNGPFQIGDGVCAIQTPGHSEQDISLLVGTPSGVVAVAGDVFEYENDWIDSAWKAWSRRPEEQSLSRQKLAASAQYIVPGHGPMFRPPPLALLGLPDPALS